MPRRREKRTDTQHSDSFQDDKARDKIVHFGTIRINRMLAPDRIEGDDSSKYSILAWVNTLQAQRLLPWNQRKQLFKRALSFLPYSYKIWHMYLTQFNDYCSSRSLQSREWDELNRQFDQALVKLPKMPRIWLMYAASLQKQQMISKARAVYNWSFRNLPLTQHQKIWRRFAEWAMRLDNSATALRIVPRYLKINPDFKQTYAEYLIQKKLYDHAASVYQAILDDEGYSGKAGKEKKDFYFELIQLLTQHPQEIKCINGYKFIRDALKLYQEDSGKIWVKLSDYYIRLGQFDKAREILQQANESVDNAKDFGIIFSAYVKYSQQMITALANEQIKNQFQVVESDNVDYQIQTRIERLQKLLKRQPYLLLNISIKKNPNQVQNWLNLINLYMKAGDLQLAEGVIEKAIATIVPEQAQGKLSEIYITYTELLQSQEQLGRCNQVLHQATQVAFRLTEDSLSVWRRWAQMLIQQGFYQDALKVVKQVLFKKKSQGDSKNKTIEQALKVHATLWQLYIDLEINLGNFQTVKTAFERCKQHRSLTPLMLLNYTNFLWDNAYFQQTFRVFQFALSNFRWPSLNEIWLSYINKFITRYGNSAAGVQRARSMFERLLRDVPKETASTFYFIYAQFQQNYGLYSHAVEIYDRMIKVVPPAEKFQAYSIYIAKVAKMLGITKARPVFEHALQNLPQKQILVMGRKYAEMQTNLGEIQRARGVFGHISQFTDPRDDTDQLWRDWQKFQVQYGDRDSYKQYLRIKRSVQAKYAMLPPDLQKIEESIKKGLV